METRLYFVRHAHSVYTPDKINRPLSDRGVPDANRVAEMINQEKIDQVIASPYKRAIQTVEKVAVYQNLKVQIENDFRERKLAEHPVNDFGEAISKVWKDATFRFEGGESNVDAQKRGVNAVLELLENHQGQNIVIGTHGNIMVLIMQYFNETYGYGFWKILEMPDIYRMTFEGKKLVEIKRCW